MKIKERNAHNVCDAKKKIRARKKMIQAKIDTTHHFLCNKKFHGIVRLWIRAASL